MGACVIMSLPEESFGVGEVPHGCHPDPQFLSIMRMGDENVLVVRGRMGRGGIIMSQRQWEAMDHAGVDAGTV